MKQCGLKDDIDLFELNEAFAAQSLAELRRRKGRYGMVTMCIGGGMGAAGVFELLA